MIVSYRHVCTPSCLWVFLIANIDVKLADDSAMRDTRPPSPDVGIWYEDHHSLTPLSKTSTDETNSARNTPATSFSESDIVALLPLQVTSSPSTASGGNHEASFDGLLHAPEVSPRFSDQFSKLRDMVFSINIRLFSNENAADLEAETLEAIEMVRSLSFWFSDFCETITDRVNTILSVTQLAPFTIHPTPKALWLVYKQRAELIVM